MMKKIVFTLFFLISYLVYGQNLPETYISPSNIKWNKEELPKDVVQSKGYQDWKKRLLDQNPPIRWSYISLVTTEKSEIIIQEQVGGSGGLNTVVLKRNSKDWSKLVDIFGGFIFYPTPSKANTLVIYERMGGDYKRMELRLNGNKYQKVSTSEVPYEWTNNSLNPPIDFHKYFWYLNTGDMKK